MPKTGEKVKVSVKDRVQEDHCDLSLSELSEIPVKEIASFKRVTVLDVSSNRLTNLGRHFPILTQLVRLDLSKNQIRYLPEDFGLLVNLRHLDLYNNCLEHLPMSFSQLRRLRYLDLKTNPLIPAWVKIVGPCSTMKECQEAAKNCVSVCANLKPEIERDRLAQVSQEREQSADKMSAGGDGSTSSLANGAGAGAKKSTKPNNKKAKLKKLAEAAEKDLTFKPVNAVGAGNGAKSASQKINQKKKSTNSTSWLNMLQKVALSTLVTFTVLVVINILLIYMLMFKNPEISEKLVEYIPHQYRDWIVTKTDLFRLRVTDWISEFRTPPEEH
ncbi:leucine-rich repeat-containing protein 59 [Drosophila pseudoobscura]|uniref:Leucine-rich repeat-containing protein 59 n=1 Tax=Drosophila pseudoobscura pseudoobscura TaxID=46245 RepID=A0A6I8UB25_DROPS|nr:leucine-rich repeat-containing protein 59 [Drosophila pseudoobscura]